MRKTFERSLTDVNPTPAPLNPERDLAVLNPVVERYLQRWHWHVRKGAVLGLTEGSSSEQRVVKFNSCRLRVVLYLMYCMMERGRFIMAK